MSAAPPRSPRYVVGVNPGFHDPTAALLRDGELVAMVEQERLSRNRRAIRESPAEAIAACLAEAGIGLDAVDEIALGWVVPSVWEEIGNTEPFEERGFAAWLLGGLARHDDRLPPLRYVDHHLAHAASAFYTSGMDAAAILVIDGRGEAVATTLASGGPGGIETVKEWGANLSIGHLFTCASRWAGLGVWGAGKLMGLAAYGRPTQAVPLAIAEDGYAIDGAPPADLSASMQLRKLRAAMQRSFQERNFPYAPGEPADVMAYADFAASMQGALEDVLFNLAEMARRETGHSKLVLAGGVALNCTANGKLIRSGMFDEVWIPPFPHDAGVSVGAALVADRASGGPRQTPPRLPHAFWAPQTGSADADCLARLAGCEVSRHDDEGLAETVARHLDEGKLVGWLQGRAEVGQRALGARSILCDPRERGTLVRANRIKGREGWRPLAPAVLEEHAAELFDGALPTAADFMLTAWPVRERAWPRLPAVVHVDGSARPQVVRPAQARYHALVRAFHERTGVPAVINTSFNLAGEPIVFTPADAVDTFLRSDLDVLVMDDTIAVKPAGAAASPAEAGAQAA